MIGIHKQQLLYLELVSFTFLHAMNPAACILHNISLGCVYMCILLYTWSTGSESAISVLENCLKHSETSSTGDVTVVATNNQQSSSSLTNETSFQGSGIDGVSTSRSSSSDGVKNVWSSELAALLSPISKSSPNVTKVND